MSVKTRRDRLRRALRPAATDPTQKISRSNQMIWSHVTSTGRPAFADGYGGKEGGPTLLMVS